MNLEITSKKPSVISPASADDGSGGISDQNAQKDQESEKPEDKKAHRISLKAEESSPLSFFHTIPSLLPHAIPYPRQHEPTTAHSPHPRCFASPELWHMFLQYLTPYEIGNLRRVDKIFNFLCNRWMTFELNVHKIRPAIDGNVYQENEIFPMLMPVIVQVKAMNLKLGTVDPHNAADTDLSARLLADAQPEDALRIERAIFLVAEGAPTWEQIFFGAQVHGQVSLLFFRLTSLTLKLQRTFGQDHSIDSLFNALAPDDNGGFFNIAKSLRSISVTSSNKRKLRVNFLSLRTFLVASRSSLQSLSLSFLEVDHLTGSPLPIGGVRMTALRFLALAEFRINNVHAKARFIALVSSALRTLTLKNLEIIKEALQAVDQSVDGHPPVSPFPKLERLYMTEPIYQAPLVPKVEALARIYRVQIKSIVVNNRKDITLINQLSSAASWAATVPISDLEGIALDTLRTDRPGKIGDFFGLLNPPATSLSSCRSLRKLEIRGNYLIFPNYIRSRIQIGEYPPTWTPQMFQSITPCAMTLTSLRLSNPYPPNEDPEIYQAEYSTTIHWVNRILRSLPNLQNFDFGLHLQDLDVFAHMVA